MERSAYWTAEDEQPVTREEAEKAWAVEAQQVLTRVAGTYRGTIESNELANELQQTTGIHTRSQVRTCWASTAQAFSASSRVTACSSSAVQ